MTSPENSSTSSLGSVVVPITVGALVLLMALALQVSWRVQEDRVGRVVTYAQSLAAVGQSSFANNTQTTNPQKSLSALIVAEPDILAAAFVQEEGSGGLGGLSGALGGLMASLQGKKILAHSNVELVGTTLSNEEQAKEVLPQALLFGEANDIKDRLERNKETRKANPSLTSNPYPTTSVLINDDDTILVVAPVMVDGTLKATAAVLASLERAKDPPIVLWVLVSAMVLLGIGYALYAKSVPGVAVMGLLFIVPTVVIGSLSYDGTTTQILEAQNQALNNSLVLWQAGSGGNIDTLATALNTDTYGEVLRRFSVQSPTSMQMAEAAFQTTGLSRWWPTIVATLILLGLVGLFLTGWARRIYDAFMGSWYAYAYIGPAMAGMLLLVFAPFAYGLGLAFFSRIYNEFHFVGMQNFVEILGNLTWDSGFYRTLGVTILWTVVNVSLHVSIGLGLALLLKDKSLKGTPIYRSLLIVPWAVPSYITALIWKGLFNKEFGAINAFLAVFGVEAISWFDTFWKAFFANVVTNTWLGFPFMMVVSLGALQSIPGDLYEAADVDGANRWAKFRYITLPLLKPALFPAVILGIIWTFNMFNVIYLVSAGGPDGQTDILITEAYRWAFERGRYGYAAAYSTIIFVILLGYTVVTNKLTKATDGAFD